MAQIHELTMIELAAAIRAGELSPVTVTDHYLRRTQELNDQVGAFFTITAELAADQALAAEKAVTTADEVAALPPLTGVPIPIKDLNMVAGVRQTLGSAAFEANVPDTDDYVVVAIKRAGAVITGKTATPEFGLPCYTETAVGPPARTPWDLSRSAGGSSGGAAAAVAAGLAPAAQGSDGGGSIRIPSSVCGLFGIKPSRGRISEGPLMPDLAGLGVNGPIARTVADAALLLDVMTGNFPGDMYTLPPGGRESRSRSSTPRWAKTAARPAKPGITPRTGSGRGLMAEVDAMIWQAVWIGFEYFQRKAGLTWTGPPGSRVDGRETGPWHETDLAVKHWLQHTSRDGDMQLHMHS
jgi:amidase